MRTAFDVATIDYAVLTVSNGFPMRRELAGARALLRAAPSARAMGSRDANAPIDGHALRRGHAACSCGTQQCGEATAGCGHDHQAATSARNATGGFQIHRCDRTKFAAERGDPLRGRRTCTCNGLLPTKHSCGCAESADTSAGHWPDSARFQAVQSTESIGYSARRTAASPRPGAPLRQPRGSSPTSVGDRGDDGRCRFEYRWGEWACSDHSCAGRRFQALVWDENAGLMVLRWRYGIRCQVSLVRSQGREVQLCSCESVPTDPPDVISVPPPQPPPIRLPTFCWTRPCNRGACDTCCDDAMISCTVSGGALCGLLCFFNPVACAGCYEYWMAGCTSGYLGCRMNCRGC